MGASNENRGRRRPLGPRRPRAFEQVERASRFGAALVAIERELDWQLLGRLYCWDDGDDFFSDEDRAAIRECGLLFAVDVAEALATLPDADGGRSIYVGAALAEIAPILCETLVLGRRVEALALPGAETDELNRALSNVAASLGLELPRIGTTSLRELPAACADHAWLVSVLTDPESFPALHDRLYGRVGTSLATGRGDVAAEQETAELLVDDLLERLRSDSVLHTTDDELALVRRGCARRGFTCEVSDRARTSAIVGDYVRCCRLRAQDA